MPTFDEIIGTGGIGISQYNEHLLGVLRPKELNVPAIHAEVEGLAMHELFSRFLTLALAEGVEFVPLSSLLLTGAEIAMGTIRRGAVPGREGWVAVQVAADETTKG